MSDFGFIKGLKGIARFEACGWLWRDGWLSKRFDDWLDSQPTSEAIDKCLIALDGFPDVKDYATHVAPLVLMCELESGPWGDCKPWVTPVTCFACKGAGMEGDDCGSCACDVCAATGVMEASPNILPCLARYIAGRAMDPNVGDNDHDEYTVLSAVEAMWKAMMDTGRVPAQSLLFVSRLHRWELIGATPLARIAFAGFVGKWTVRKKRLCSPNPPYGVRFPRNARPDGTLFRWDFPMNVESFEDWSLGDEVDRTFTLSDGTGSLITTLLARAAILRDWQSAGDLLGEEHENVAHEVR